MRFRVTVVEVGETVEGWPVPVAVLWDGERLPVVEVGRRWRCADGTHLLARVADGRVFELHTNGSLWRAAVIAEPPQYV